MANLAQFKLYTNLCRLNNLNGKCVEQKDICSFTVTSNKIISTLKFIVAILAMCNRN